MPESPAAKPGRIGRIVFASLQPHRRGPPGAKNAWRQYVAGRLVPVYHRRQVLIGDPSPIRPPSETLPADPRPSPKRFAALQPSTHHPIFLRGTRLCYSVSFGHFCSRFWFAAQPRLVWAEVTPSNLFSDNAVLQRDVKLPVWGTTDKPEKVTVNFAGQEVSAQPADGQWQVELEPLAASSESRTLTVTQGGAKVERKNILVGDVWVCSGQSNMEWPLEKTAGAAEAIATAKNDKLRLFTVPRKNNPQPQTTVGGDWSVTSPEINS